MRFCLTALLFASALPLLAQDPDPFGPGALLGGTPAAAKGPEVKVSLVAASDGIAPGGTTAVALKLEHADHWHTYWINPGLGTPTTIKWTLPEGFTASPILWPIPQAVATEVGNQHVYSGTVYLVTDIKAPESAKIGETVKLSAKVEWQVCEDGGSCIPQDASLTLDLPVSASPPPIATTALAVAAVRTAQPQESPAWTVTAVTTTVKTTDADGETGSDPVIRLTLKAQDGANADPGELYFFDRTAALLNEPQTVSRDGAAWVLSAKYNPKKPPAEGFLHASKGWLADGSLRALAFKMPLDSSSGNPPATPADSNPSDSGNEQPAAAGSAADRPDEWETGTGRIDFVEYRPDLTVNDLRSGSASRTTPPGFWKIMGLMFLGGIILNLMPCVFPVLGYKIMGFAQLAGQDRRKLLLHAAAFTAGLVFFVWVLGLVIFIAKKSFGTDVAWGFFAQSAYGSAAIVGILFLLGLNLWGVFELGTSLTTVGGDLQDKKGYSGSFFSGILTTVISTPCSGPFLGVAMAYTLSQTAAVQFLLLTAFGLGIALPYVLLSTSPAVIRRLPKPGAWMETLKKALAFPMFAACIYFLSGFMNLTGTSGGVRLLFALLLAAIGVWIYGHWATPVRKPATRATAWALLAACLAAAVSLASSAASLKPAAETASDDDGWTRWSPRTVADLQKAGRPIFVDYTTHNCLTCDLNENRVFKAPGADTVMAAFERTKTAMLKARYAQDNSPPNVAIVRSLERFERKANFPVYVVYPADPALRPFVLPVVIDQKTVIHALELASAKPSV
ncbi:MAG: hypothetical protein RLZZ179_268 [Verrucomicrobiota bacterium]|jgi:thiol:disulfide interchange protein DsbD